MTADISVFTKAPPVLPALSFNCMVIWLAGYSWIRCWLQHQVSSFPEIKAIKLKFLKVSPRSDTKPAHRTYDTVFIVQKRRLRLSKIKLSRATPAVRHTVKTWAPVCPTTWTVLFLGPRCLPWAFPDNHALPVQQQHWCWHLLYKTSETLIH